MIPKKITTIVMTVLFMATTMSVFSQVQGKVRAGLDYGHNFFFPKTEYRGFSPITDIYLGYNLKDDMNVGVKIGLAEFHVRNKDILYDCNIANITSTYTYYFGSRTNLVIPFVGGGLGVYFMKSWEIGKVIYDKFGNVVGQFVVTNPNIRNTTNFVSYGGFISTGFEFGKFRLAAKYVLIPSKAHTLYRYNYNTQSLTGEFITERFRNNYMSISVGFYIGGGNRKKAAAIQASKRTVQPAQERLTPNEREKTATLEREKPAETAQSPVSNTRVELVDSVLLITYNLEAKSDIELHISIDNGERFIGPMQLVSGAVGKGIEPENNKIMMWEIVEEIGLMDFSNVVVRVVATERR